MPTADPVYVALPYRAPFDWDALLGFLAARAIPAVEAVARGAYRRTIELHGEAGVVVVSHEARHERLRAEIRFPRPEALATVAARLRGLFDLDADPLAIGEALAGDPRLAPLVAARPGLRVPGAWDGFELAVRAIAGQQITVTAATRLVGVLVERYGRPIAADFSGLGLTRLFPAASILATAAIGGMPAARARTLNAVAAAAMADEHLFAPGAGLDRSLARLTALPGIGPWTANYIAMRAMREPDAFPEGDVALMRALDGGAGRPGAVALEQRARAWRPWRAYAALHLWTHLAAPTYATSHLGQD